jgi:hypothetical protein
MSAFAVVASIVEFLLYLPENLEAHAVVAAGEPISFAFQGG